MSDHTPSTHLLTALDAPFRFLRERFSDYAPTVSVLVVISAAVSAVQGFVTSRNMLPTAGGADPFEGLKALPAFYAMLLPGILIFAVCSAAQAVCVGRVLANKDASLGACFGALASPRLWGPLIATLLVMGVNLACCCYGGFLIMLPLGLILPAALDEDLGLSAIPRSFAVSMTRTGPEFFDRPGWKVVAVALAGWLAAMALGMVAAIPTYVVLGQAYFEAIKSGHPENITKAVASLPVWVTTANAVLGSFARVFPSVYGYAAVFLIYRDAVARVDGSDLEKMIADRPGA